MHPEFRPTSVVEVQTKYARRLNSGVAILPSRNSSENYRINSEYGRCDGGEYFVMRLYDYFNKLRKRRSEYFNELRKHRIECFNELRKHEKLPFQPGAN